MIGELLQAIAMGALAQYAGAPAPPPAEVPGAAGLGSAVSEALLRLAQQLGRAPDGLRISITDTMSTIVVAVEDVHRQLVLGTERISRHRVAAAASPRTVIAETTLALIELTSSRLARVTGCQAALTATQLTVTALHTGRPLHRVECPVHGIVHPGTTSPERQEEYHRRTGDVHPRRGSER